MPDANETNTDDLRQISIQLDTRSQQDSIQHRLDVNSSREQVKACARGKGIRIFMGRMNIKNESFAELKERSYNSKNFNESMNLAVVNPLKYTSSKELFIESKQVLSNDESFTNNQLHHQIFEDSQTTNEYENENVEYNNSLKWISNTSNNHSPDLSRTKIEREIEIMVRRILELKDNQDNESINVGDCYSHIDLLFEKMNCPRQSVWKYFKYNANIYNKGIDMKYIIQSFFGVHHIQEENWINIYSKYLEHPIVYATIGIHPLLAHHFDFTLELNMRRIMRNPKIIGIGEIGLDFLSERRPDNDIQIATFIKQLRLAKEKSLPVVIISRNSFIETLNCLTTSLRLIILRSSKFAFLSQLKDAFLLFQELDINHRIHWRNFIYGQEEQDMILSKMNNVFFGCSPQTMYNKRMRMNIERTSLNYILPESVSPHMTVPECPNVWETHPIFVIQVYKFIGQLFQLNIRQTVQQLNNNIEYFYKIN